MTTKMITNKDANRAAQARRREKLHQIAQAAGYPTWYKLVTAILAGEVIITKTEASSE